MIIEFVKCNLTFIEKQNKEAQYSDENSPGHTRSREWGLWDLGPNMTRHGWNEHNSWTKRSVAVPSLNMEASTPQQPVVFSVTRFWLHLKEPFIGMVLVLSNKIGHMNFSDLDSVTTYQKI